MPNGALLEISEEHLASSNGALYARVGISWLSPEQACKYAEGEIPNIDEGQFNMTLAAAELKWDATLGTVQIDPGHVSTDRLTLFWSSLYRTYISPNNITGDNPLWESSEPYYDSMYCIWDSFRVVSGLHMQSQAYLCGGIGSSSVRYHSKSRAGRVRSCHHRRLPQYGVPPRLSHVIMQGLQPGGTH